MSRFHRRCSLFSDRPAASYCDFGAGWLGVLESCGALLNRRQTSIAYLNFQYTCRSRRQKLQFNHSFLPHMVSWRIYGSIIHPRREPTEAIERRRQQHDIAEELVSLPRVRQAGDTKPLSRRVALPGQVAIYCPTTVWPVAGGSRPPAHTAFLRTPRR